MRAGDDFPFVISRRVRSPRVSKGWFVRKEPSLTVGLLTRRNEECQMKNGKRSVAARCHSYASLGHFPVIVTSTSVFEGFIDPRLDPAFRLSTTRGQL